MEDLLPQYGTPPGYDVAGGYPATPGFAPPRVTWHRVTPRRRASIQRATAHRRGTWPSRPIPPRSTPRRLTAQDPYGQPPYGAQPAPADHYAQQQYEPHQHAPAEANPFDDPFGARTPAAPVAGPSASGVHAVVTTTPAKSSKTLYLVIGLGALVLIGGAATGAVLMLRDPKPELAANDKSAASEKTPPKDTKKKVATPNPQTVASPPTDAVATPAKETPVPTPAKVAAKDLALRGVPYKHADPARCWAVSHDGTTLALATEKGEVDGYDLTAHRRVWSYEDSIGIGMPWKIEAMTFSSPRASGAGSPVLAISGRFQADDVFLVAVDAKDGKELNQYHALHAPAPFLAFPAGQTNRVVAGLGDKTGSLQLIDLAEDRVAAEILEGHESPIRGLAISPDATLCVTTSSKAIEGKDAPGSVLTVWSLAVSGREKEFAEFAGVAGRIAISPDGKLLAVHESDGASGSLRLFRFPELEPLKTISGVAPTIGERWDLVSFLPDNATLAVAVGTDVIFYDAATGERKPSLPQAFAAAPQGLLLSRDGKTAVTSSGEKEFKVWKLP
ncbi:MAG: hypothetical protein QM811_03355 [Pirellulales bacterium]